MARKPNGTFRPWLAMALAGLAVAWSAAGERLAFKPYSLREGLSQVTVNFVYQDAKGFLWIGTDDGLNRYDGYTFKIYNHDPADPDSLSDNSVKSIWEDADGFLWVATFNGGLNRLDPATGKAVRYRHDPDDPHSLSSDSIAGVGDVGEGLLLVAPFTGGFDLFDRKTGRAEFFAHDPQNPASLPHNGLIEGLRAPNGLIWIATPNGVCSFDPRTRAFRRYQHDPQDPQSLSGNFALDLFLDRDGALWVAAANHLNRFDFETESFTRFHHNMGGPGPQTSLSPNPLYQDRAGYYWVGGPNGAICRFDPRTETFRRYPPPDFTPRFSSYVGGFVEDGDGRLWALWNDNGLFHYDAEADRWRLHQSDPMDPDSLNTDTARSLFLDRAGALWVGTADNGLNKFDPNRLKFPRYVHEPGNPDSMARSGVRCFLKDSDGGYWVGAQFTGLYHWERGADRFTSYRFDVNDTASLSNDDVRFLAEDSRGRFWVGSFGGGLNRFDRTRGRFSRISLAARLRGSRALDFLRDIVEDDDGVLWLATHGGLVRWDTATDAMSRYQAGSAEGSLSHNVITDLLIDREQRIWAATFGGGLNRFDPKDGRFTAYRADLDNPRGLSHNLINCVFQDRDGALWLGSWGGGLNRFDPETGTARRYTVSDGLPNNVIYGIQQDTAGMLWLSTNRGLCRLNAATGETRNYDMSDGLQSYEFNSGAYYRANDGELMFGGVSGFNAFYPERLQDRVSPPPVVITAFKRFDRMVAADIADTRSFTLSHRDNHFSFEFAALDFANPAKNQYAYRLSGVDPDWVSAKSRRYASYTNIEPGDYTFTVRAANADGVWNEEGVSVAITITPPFWQTWQFRGLQALAAILALVGLIVVLRRRAERQKQAALRALDLERKTDELNRARDVQLSMLPKSDLRVKRVEIVGRTRPATEVGGDYFDFIQLPEPWFCAVWGDATGHGMTAGLIVGMTKAALINTLQTTAARNMPVVLRNLNATLKQSIPQRGIGMGLGLALFNLDNLTAEVASAGMPFSYRYRAEAGTLESIELRCPPLGFLRDVPAVSQRVQLAPGDALIFLSDGLGERANREGVFWNRHGLETEALAACRRAESAAEIADSLMAACDRFAADLENEDDMTVVVVRALAEP